LPPHDNKKQKLSFIEPLNVSIARVCDTYVVSIIKTNPIKLEKIGGSANNGDKELPNFILV
jgi:hypothetical protein